MAAVTTITSQGLDTIHPLHKASEAAPFILPHLHQISDDERRQSSPPIKQKYLSILRTYPKSIDDQVFGQHSISLNSPTNLPTNLISTTVYDPTESQPSSPTSLLLNSIQQDLSLPSQANCISPSTQASFGASFPNTHRRLVASKSSPIAQPFNNYTKSPASPTEKKTLYSSTSEGKSLLSPYNIKAYVAPSPYAKSSSTSAQKLFLPTNAATHSHKSNVPSPLPHKPLIAQRSSPTQFSNKSHTKTLTVTPPISPLCKRSPRKLSCPKVTRASPTQFQFPYQYSKVPKSDSAYSEEPYSYSPIPRGNSPWSDFQNSYSYIPSYDTQSFDGQYICSGGIPKSDSAFLDNQRSPFRPSSYIPKSHSTILRSDSAFSDIEYSYSTIPQSDSCYLDKEYSYSSLPKSDSMYSENIICSDSSPHKGLIPRSFSTYSHKLVKFSDQETTIDPGVESNKYFHKGNSSASYTPSPLSDRDILYSASNHQIVSKDTSILSCQLSPTNVIMPTLKSFLKPPSRHSNGKKSNKYEKSSSENILPRDTSVPILKLMSTSTESKIKKSHTVLALSSNLSSSNSASTKLLEKEGDGIGNTCSISNCLSKSLKHSISQTLNQSIGQNLHKLGGAKESSSHSQNKRLRKSTLSGFLPRSFSRSSSIAPSLTSARGSYLGSYVGSCEADDTLYCRLCLMDVSVDMMCQLTVCQCRFCRYVSTFTCSINCPIRIRSHLYCY